MTAAFALQPLQQIGKRLGAGRDGVEPARAGDAARGVGERVEIDLRPPLLDCAGGLDESHGLVERHRVE
jgi:hypothetical protein